MSRSKPIKEIEAMLAERKTKLALIQAEIKTIEEILRRAKGEDKTQAAENTSKGRRTNVKGIVLALLQERAGLGLTAGTAVELAEQRGIKLEKATVSSLLSRLKNDGIATYADSVYRWVSRNKSGSTSDSLADVLH